MEFPRVSEMALTCLSVIFVLGMLHEEAFSEPAIIISKYRSTLKNTEEAVYLQHQIFWQE